MISSRRHWVAVAIGCAFLPAGCGSSKPTEPNVGAGASSTTASTTPSTTPAAKAPSDPRLAKKPVVAKPSGPLPTHLVKRDLVVGQGPEAKAGSSVSVQYVGVLAKTGKQFDASWDRGQPFPFQLGARQVIAGWDQGVPGMRVGGRRELIIPASLAYGANGPPGIGPNQPLVFVIDLLSVG